MAIHELQKDQTLSKIENRSPKKRYFKKMIFQFKGTEYTVDSVLSKALALALNIKIPVMVNADLLPPVPSKKDIEDYEKYITDPIL
jgi:hypothetical protein